MNKVGREQEAVFPIKLDTSERKEIVIGEALHYYYNKLVSKVHSQCKRGYPRLYSNIASLNASLRDN